MALDTSSIAIIVVDAIDSVTDETDTVYANELSPEMASFRSCVARVIEIAHGRGIPVLYCNDEHLEGIDRELALWGPHGIKGKTRIFPEVAVAEGDIVIPKRRYSGFFQTDLDLTLRELGATKLVVIGCDTNVCVLHTLADAFYLNYETIVVEDATITFLGVGTQEGAIDMFGKCYGTTIVTTDELAEMLG